MNLIEKEMTIEEGLNLRNVLNSTELKNSKNLKFNYRIIKLNKQINEKVKDAEEMIKPSEQFLEYERARLSLLMNYGEKDENGKIKIIDGNVVIPDEKTEEFNQKITDLQEQYKETLDERKKQLEDYEKFIKEEKIKVEFIPFNIDDLENVELTSEIIEPLIDIGFLIE